jgi:hypothetical protein
MAPSRRCGLPRRKIPHQIWPVENRTLMPDGGPEPGTAAMIVASTSQNPTGNRSTITGRFLSRASAVPSPRKRTSARAGLRHAALRIAGSRFGESLATKKWWIHLLK